MRYTNPSMHITNGREATV